MNFLPDLYVPCPVCEGKRFNRQTLEIRYRGLSIADVLDLRVDEAAEFFQNHPAIARLLGSLQEVGLGYVTLGQSSITLSGGEAQRIKLATELGRVDTGKTFYILDEPTTGLHFDDIKKLLAVLGRLVDLGNTVVVIEHNIDVMKTADWIIDLGPEGGDDGGYVVATGTPGADRRDGGQLHGEVLAGIFAGPRGVKEFSAASMCGRGWRSPHRRHYPANRGSCGIGDWTNCRRGPTRQRRLSLPRPADRATAVRHRGPCRLHQKCGSSANVAAWSKSSGSTAIAGCLFFQRAMAAWGQDDARLEARQAQRGANSTPGRISFVWNGRQERSDNRLIFVVKLSSLIRPRGRAGTRSRMPSRESCSCKDRRINNCRIYKVSGTLRVPPATAHGVCRIHFDSPVPSLGTVPFAVMSHRTMHAVSQPLHK